MNLVEIATHLIFQYNLKEKLHTIIKKANLPNQLNQIKDMFSKETILQFFILLSFLISIKIFLNQVIKIIMDIELMKI